jgi:hypothetical protein
VLKLAVTILLAVGVGALVLPLTGLCERNRRRLAFASLFLCPVVVGLDRMTMSSESPPSPVSPSMPAVGAESRSAAMVPQTAMTNSELNATKPSSSSTITAMRGKKSLFVEIRRDGNLYCAADNPALMVAEFDGQFVALNGNSRSWASNQGLSVYLDRAWLPVVDTKITDPKYDVARIQPLIDKSSKLCPTVISPGSDYLNEASRRLSEGETRFIERGAEFGLPSDDGSEVAKMAPTVSCSQFRQRFTDTLTGNREGIALYLLFTGPKQEKFDVPGIQAAIGCTPDRMFQGFGASLLETDDANIRRFGRFIAAAVRATEQRLDHEAALAFVLELSKHALQVAHEGERKAGILLGDAEGQLGPYVVTHSFNNGRIRTGIELRDKE